MLQDQSLDGSLLVAMTIDRGSFVEGMASALSTAYYG